MVLVTTMVSAGSQSGLSFVFGLVLCVLAFRYGFWGAIWRWFLVCTIVFIPLLLMARTQLPGEQRRRRYSYY